MSETAKLPDGSSPALKPGDRFRYREHPAVTGKVVRYEYFRLPNDSEAFRLLNGGEADPGELSAIPYVIEHDDDSFAKKALGTDYWWWAGDKEIEPLPQEAQT